MARQAPDARHRNIENDVVIPVGIRLHDFTNKKIGHAMEVLASMLGPSTEKEPARKGTGKMDSPRWRLDGFIVNALGVVVSNVSPQRGLQSVRGEFTALDRFNEIRLGVSRSKSADESNF